MSIQNTMYNGYKLMMEGYKEGGDQGDNKMQVGINTWLANNPDNPFTEGTPEYDAFFRMKLHYSLWQSDDPSKRVSMRRAMAAAKEMCKKYPKNPYKFDRKADNEEKQQHAALQAEYQKKKEEEEALAIQREAERIVQEEIRREEEAAIIEQAKREYEKQEAEERARQEKRAADLKTAVDAKRAEYKAKREAEIAAAKKLIETKNEDVLSYGAVEAEPSPVVLNVVEPKKKGFFKRLFHKE